MSDFYAKHTYEDFLNYLRKHKNDDLEIKYNEYLSTGVKVEKVKVYSKEIYGCYHFEKESALWRTKDVCSPYVVVKILFKRDMKEYNVKKKRSEERNFRFIIKDPFRNQLEDILDNSDEFENAGYSLDNSDHIFKYIVESVFVTKETYWLDVYKDTVVYDSSDNSDNEDSDDDDVWEYGDAHDVNVVRSYMVGDEFEEECDDYPISEFYDEFSFVKFEEYCKEHKNDVYKRFPSCTDEYGSTVYMCETTVDITVKGKMVFGFADKRRTYVEGVEMVCKEECSLYMAILYFIKRVIKDYDKDIYKKLVIEEYHNGTEDFHKFIGKFITENSRMYIHEVPNYVKELV